MTKGASVLIAILMVGCLCGSIMFGSYIWARKTPEYEAINALKAAGYKEIKITDRDNFWFTGCSRENLVKFTAEAITINGDKIKCYVCGGGLSNMTIRY